MARPSKYTSELRRRAVEEVLDRDRKVGEVAARDRIETRVTVTRDAQVDRADLRRHRLGIRTVAPSYTKNRAVRDTIQ
jgi:hypothetical protein